MTKKKSQSRETRHTCANKKHTHRHKHTNSSSKRRRQECNQTPSGTQFNLVATSHKTTTVRDMSSFARRTSADTSFSLCLDSPIRDTHTWKDVRHGVTLRWHSAAKRQSANRISALRERTCPLPDCTGCIGCGPCCDGRASIDTHTHWETPVRKHHATRLAEEQTPQTQRAKRRRHHATVGSCSKHFIGIEHSCSVGEERLPESCVNERL